MSSTLHAPSPLRAPQALRSPDIRDDGQSLRDDDRARNDRDIRNTSAESFEDALDRRTSGDQDRITGRERLTETSISADPQSDGDTTEIALAPPADDMIALAPNSRTTTERLNESASVMASLADGTGAVRPTTTPSVFDNAAALPAQTTPTPAQTAVSQDPSATPRTEPGNLVQDDLRIVAGSTTAPNAQSAAAAAATDADITTANATIDTDVADLSLRQTNRQNIQGGATHTELNTATQDAPKWAPATDTVKLSDDVKLPSTPSTANLAATDSSAPIKSLPVSLVTPTINPLHASSDRLAATILQSANAQSGPVTLDKLPQAVVAVALSAKSATLQIDPPEMGRIQLDYQFDVQGRTVVTLTPESEAARAALMDRMSVIAAALEQGANGPIDVMLSDPRDFGASYGQASDDHDQDSGQNGSARDGIPADVRESDQPRAYTRTGTGENERLHIRV